MQIMAVMVHESPQLDDTTFMKFFVLMDLVGKDPENRMTQKSSELPASMVLVPVRDWLD